MKYLKFIIENADKEFGDGETNIDDCILQYCKLYGINNKTCEAAQTKAFQDEALSHGIPLSVIQGKKKLSDIFSSDYINYKCNKKKVSE